MLEWWSASIPVIRSKSLIRWKCCRAYIHFLSIDVSLYKPKTTLFGWCATVCPLALNKIQHGSRDIIKLSNVHYVLLCVNLGSKLRFVRQANLIVDLKVYLCNLTSTLAQIRLP